VKRHKPIPKSHPVQPLKPNQKAKDKATCGYCGLSWDDGKATSMTPTPSARCPFEYFHIHDGEDPMTRHEFASLLKTDRDIAIRTLVSIMQDDHYEALLTVHLGQERRLADRSDKDLLTRFDELSAGGEEESVCTECGEPCQTNPNGTTNHIDLDGDTDFDRDADHVALPDLDEEG
jgi:hypothetical protein